MMDDNNFKSHFVFDDTITHFNNAGLAPTSQRARAAIDECVSLLSRQGSYAYDELMSRFEGARGSLAKLLGTQASDVSWVHTCSAGISQAAFGLPLSKGKHILRWDQEYASNAYPWEVAARDAGARVVHIQSAPNLSVDTERLIDAITEDTATVAISWVQFSTGATTLLRPVADKCHKVGAHLVVDVTQGLGVVPFDMNAMDVDVVCGASHKWLCAPPGHGFLVMSEKLRSKMRPLSLGARSFGDNFNAMFDSTATLRRDEKRFEPGSPLLMGAVGLGASSELILEMGVDVLNHAAIAVAHALYAGLVSRGARVLSPEPVIGRSPILTFVPVDNEVEQVFERLGENRIMTSPRGGGIRLSPHAFNTVEDVQRFFAVLDGL